MTLARFRCLAMLPWLVSASISPPAWAKPWFESDGYMPGDPMPLSVYGAPAGTAETVTIKLPDDYDAEKAPLAVLWLVVDDIDLAKETSIHINGHGPFEPPKSTLGEGAGEKGYGRNGFLKIDPGILKPGANVLKFVFEDNLNGSTGGFLIFEAMLVVVRPDGPVNSIPMIKREVYIDVADFGKLAVYDSSLEARRIRLRRGEDPVGWKPHDIRKGDGKGGWTYQKGEFQFLHAPYGKWLMPFGLARMDNGEVVLAGMWNDGTCQRVVLSFSKDRGQTWSDWRNIRIGHGRPMMLAALGNGKLTFATGRRYFSSDYGRTWPWAQRIVKPLAANGGRFDQEGNALVDYDANGIATRIMELGSNFGKGKFPVARSRAFIRTSTDGGRTWTEQPAPKQWQWTDTYEGKTYERSVCEGSLVRAKNGWIVAAVRPDVPAKFFHRHHDHYMGIAVSVSKDDGKTWTPLQFLYKLGRMHPHLLAMPNGDAVMGYILRQDLRDDGSFASYNRGCEAIVSHDGGMTWDLAHKYVLDAWQYVDPQKGPSTLACGHTCSVLLDNGDILTAYGQYLSKGIAMIRWRP